MSHSLKRKHDHEIHKIYLRLSSLEISRVGRKCIKRFSNLFLSLRKFLFKARVSYKMSTSSYASMNNDELMTRLRRNFSKLEDIAILVLSEIAADDSANLTIKFIAAVGKDKLSANKFNTQPTQNIILLIEFLKKDIERYNKLAQTRDLEAISSLIRDMLTETTDIKKNLPIDIDAIDFSMFTNYISKLDQESLDIIWKLVNNILSIVTYYKI